MDDQITDRHCKRSEKYSHTEARIMEKKNEKKDEKKGRYLRREFSYTKFQQAMILPDDVDRNKISAKVENGVLEVELPKVPEEAKVAKITNIEVK